MDFGEREAGLVQDIEERARKGVRMSILRRVYGTGPRFSIPRGNLLVQQGENSFAWDCITSHICHLVKVLKLHPFISCCYF